MDSTAFYLLASQGQNELLSMRPDSAAQKLKCALALWRGPIGEDVPDTEPLQSWANHLTELRHTTIENLAEAQLLLNDCAWIFANIRPHLAECPLRERPVGILMRALHLAGDRQGAFNVYQDYRRLLVEGLGVDPSIELQKLYVSLLDARTNPLQPFAA
ncbi:AfsR/SARP family transcriptional regulator [Streptomyces sp. NPDC051218]|uniref:AfsR/SARP family transcriptional regulator n=1 Tax=Streptomyces sp. NPDC051218 TaxID=3365645 RepID=UPI00378FFFB1